MSSKTASVPLHSNNGYRFKLLLLKRIEKLGKIRVNFPDFDLQTAANRTTTLTHESEIAITEAAAKST